MSLQEARMTSLADKLYSTEEVEEKKPRKKEDKAKVDIKKTKEKK